MRKHILIAILALAVSACDFTAQDAERLLSQVNSTIARVEGLVGHVVRAYEQAERVAHELHDVVIAAKGEPHPCAGVSLPLPMIEDVGAELWEDCVALETTRDGAAAGESLPTWHLSRAMVGLYPVHAQALQAYCGCMLAVHGDGYQCVVVKASRRGWEPCHGELATCLERFGASVVE